MIISNETFRKKLDEAFTKRMPYSGQATIISFANKKVNPSISSNVITVDFTDENPFGA